MTDPVTVIDLVTLTIGDPMIDDPVVDGRTQLLLVWTLLVLVTIVIGDPVLLVYYW